MGQEVSNKIVTVPNVISFIRLCMVPIFFILLIQGQNLAACIVFAVAAITDFIDGKIARATNTVTKLGQILDPAVDRALMIFGVIGLAIIGRLPIWILALILGRDVLFLLVGGFMIKKYQLRVPVIYLGKIVTTLLFTGFAGLLLNWPLIPGLAICSFTWLPGFCSGMFSWGIWLVYLGLFLGLITSVYYAVKMFNKYKLVKSGKEITWE